MRKGILTVIAVLIPTLAACENPVDLSMPAPHAECWGSMGCPGQANWPKELPAFPVTTP